MKLIKCTIIGQNKFFELYGPDPLEANKKNSQTPINKSNVFETVLVFTLPK